MKTTTLAVSLILLAATASTRALATVVDLHLSVTPSTSTTGTWTVTADLGANSSGDLGLASFSLDIDGTSTTQGISIQKAAIVSQTNQTPNPPYSVLRTYWHNQRPEFDTDFCQSGHYLCCKQCRLLGPGIRRRLTYPRNELGLWADTCTRPNHDCDRPIHDQRSRLL